MTPLSSSEIAGLDRYPLAELDSTPGRALVPRCNAELAAVGAREVFQGRDS